MMMKIITKLSGEMIAWKRQWFDVARRKTRRHGEELKGNYQRTIEHTENMIIELDSFFIWKVL